MQIEQLEFIVSVASNGSFSKTAERLHVSQSAISQSVKKLEDEIGIQIFKRTRSGAVPTESGKQIIEQAEDVLLKFNELKRKVVELNKSKQKELKIGLVSGMHLPFIPSILLELKEEFPHLSIIFAEKSSVEITDAIIEKDLDIGVVAIYEKTVKKQGKIQFETLRGSNMFVFVNKESPFATLDFVTPQQLLSQRFVMFNGEFMNWYFNEFTGQYGEVEVLFTSNNNETIREAVSKGHAITIESEIELFNNPSIRNGEIIPVPLIANVAKEFSLGFTILKNNSTSIEAKTFMKLFKQHINEIVNQEPFIYFSNRKSR
ncbi:LysR family transcriptional regulator [Bacillus salipaludis]|uniref:LysR family transcriptional regulator n=1 Tax=Bacillus salipaludis TaxID=2547811 RepID=A0ABW8RHV7_9BACI